MRWLDLHHFPAATGSLARFLRNSHGDVDGLLFADGTEINVSSQWSGDVTRQCDIGDTITVHGVRPSDADVIVAVAIDTANGVHINASSPHSEPPGASLAPIFKIEHTGIITCRVHDPNGHVHGVLLDDGVMVRFPAHCVGGFDTLLVEGKPFKSQRSRPGNELWHRDRRSSC